MPTTSDRQTGLDLATASLLLDERFDIPAGPSFYDTVTGLWRTNRLLDHAKLAASIARASIPSTPIPESAVPHGYKVVKRGGRKSGWKTTVRAAEIKKRAPRAYEDCRILVPTTRVQSTLEKPLITGLPTAPMRMTLEQIARAGDIIRAQRAVLKPRAEQLKARLIVIGQATGWEAGTTTDGWDITAAQRRFDPDRFAELYPELWSRHAETVEVKAIPSYFALVPVTVVTDEEDEFDAD